MSTLQEMRLWALGTQRENMRVLVSMKSDRVAPWTGGMNWSDEVMIDVNADPTRAWNLHGIRVPSESILVTIWMERPACWREIAVVSPEGVEWVMGANLDDLTRVLPGITVA